MTRRKKLELIVLGHAILEGNSDNGIFASVDDNEKKQRDNSVN